MSEPVLDRFLEVARSPGPWALDRAPSACFGEFADEEILAFVQAIKIGEYDEEKRRFIERNNAAVLTKLRGRRPLRLLVLIPRCLVTKRCNCKMELGLEQCQELDGCSVVPLKRVARERGLDLRFARRSANAVDFVAEVKPDLTVAYACEDRLVKGMIRTRGLPAYGIPIGLPEGVCVRAVADEGKLVELLEAL
ncbi:MAG: DUF116 domain-containing protein [Planctomycetota bacterium]